MFGLLKFAVPPILRLPGTVRFPLASIVSFAEVEGPIMTVLSLPFVMPDPNAKELFPVTVLFVPKAPEPIPEMMFPIPTASDWLLDAVFPFPTAMASTDWYGLYAIAWKFIVPEETVRKMSP